MQQQVAVQAAPMQQVVAQAVGQHGRREVTNDYAALFVALIGARPWRWPYTKPSCAPQQVRTRSGSMGGARSPTTTPRSSSRSSVRAPGVGPIQNPHVHPSRCAGARAARAPGHH